MAASSMSAPERITVSDALEDQAWDAFLASVPGGDHLQSSGWARTKHYQGYETLRVVAERGGRIVGGAQVLLRRPPLLGAIGYIPRGPVVEAGETDAAKAIIEKLQELARSERINHLIVQPGRTGTTMAQRLPSWGFVPSAMEVAPAATVLVDLRADVDTILSRMSKSARRHIRKGTANELEITKGTAADLGTFSDLLAVAARRHGFTPYPPDYYQAMWEAMHPQGHLQLFLVTYGSEVLTAHLVVPFGDVLLSKISAWSGAQGSLYPNEVIEWHMIRWAKEHGCSYYDFEGFNRGAAEAIVRDGGNPAEEAHSADAFKLKFGGEVVLFPTAYDYFPKRLVANTYGRAYRHAFTAGDLKPSIARLRTLGRRSSDEQS